MQAAFALVVEGSFVAANGGILGVQVAFVPLFEETFVAIFGGIPSLQAVCAPLLRRGWGRFLGEGARLTCI